MNSQQTKTVTVTYCDNRTEEIQIRQLPLPEYQRALAVLDDEIALTALFCGKEKSWLLGTPPDQKDAVTPESYEALQTAAREANEKVFFAFAHRNTLFKEKQQERMLAAMDKMPPEFVTQIMQLGAAHLSNTKSGKN